jgi:hypothetical protein
LLRTRERGPEFRDGTPVFRGFLRGAASGFACAVDVGFGGHFFHSQCAAGFVQTFELRLRELAAATADGGFRRAGQQV